MGVFLSLFGFHSCERTSRPHPADRGSKKPSSREHQKDSRFVREICSRLRRLLQRGLQKALRFEIVDLGATLSRAAAKKARRALLAKACPTGSRLCASLGKVS